MTTTQEGAARADALDQSMQRPALRRSRSNRVLFGVGGGLGHYLGIDPVLVRVAFVLLAVFGGSGVLLYLIALVAIPSEAPGELDAQAAGGFDLTVANGGGVVLGGVLVAVGALLLAGRVIPGFGDLFAPLVLLSAGVLVILAARR